MSCSDVAWGGSLAPVAAGAAVSTTPSSTRGSAWTCSQQTPLVKMHFRPGLDAAHLTLIGPTHCEACIRSLQVQL